VVGGERKSSLEWLVEQLSVRVYVDDVWSYLWWLEKMFC